jgi:hypothetical protein
VERFPSHPPGQQWNANCIQQRENQRALIEHFSCNLEVSGHVPSCLIVLRFKGEFNEAGAFQRFEFPRLKKHSRANMAGKCLLSL